MKRVLSLMLAVQGPIVLLPQGDPARHSTPGPSRPRRQRRAGALLATSGEYPLASGSVLGILLGHWADSSIVRAVAANLDTQLGRKLP